MKKNMKDYESVLEAKRMLDDLFTMNSYYGMGGCSKFVRDFWSMWAAASPRLKVALAAVGDQFICTDLHWDPKDPKKEGVGIGYIRFDIPATRDVLTVLPLYKRRYKNKNLNIKLVLELDDRWGASSFDIEWITIPVTRGGEFSYCPNMRARKRIAAAVR